MKLSRYSFIAIFILSILLVPTSLFASNENFYSSMTHRMTSLVLELAMIILCARIGGIVFSRYLKQPSVLGELIAGMIIGPHALGGLDLPFANSLFSTTLGSFPVSPELYGIATVASIVLLFLAGLETDLTIFLRYSISGTIIGISGVIASFAAGDFIAVWFKIAPDFMHPTALFLGAISTATSVGITARILSEKRKLDSPEGVTILSAAVIDDVLGIIVLAVIVGISKFHIGSTSEINWYKIGMIALKAVGFWIICTSLGLILAKKITETLKWFRTPEIIASLSLGLALFLAGLSELAGLAMIIGAYIMGLALSKTDIKYELYEKLHGTYEFLVPVFFCVMGMLVNFKAMKGVFVFGLIYSIFAIFSKVIGCGFSAWITSFKPIGALRIGLGMLPRGEVALIIAGIGLATNIINQEIFGISIMMTLITTLIAPPMLAKAFEGQCGAVKDKLCELIKREKKIIMEFPNQAVSDFVRMRLLLAFRNEAFFIHRINPGLPIYQLRRDDVVLTIIQEGTKLLFETSPDNEQIVRFVIAEEFLELEEMFESLKAYKGADKIGHEMFAGAFDVPKE